MGLVGLGFFFDSTPSASGCVHKCLIVPAARWSGLVLNARSKSAPVRRRLQRTEWTGSSSSLAARYPHRDCTYSDRAEICLRTAAIPAAFSGARTRSMSWGAVCCTCVRSVSIVSGVSLDTLARPDASPVNIRDCRSLMLS